MRQPQTSLFPPQMHSECKRWVNLSPWFFFLAFYFKNPGLSVLILTCGTGKEAGEAFERAAAVQRQHLNEPDDEANSLTEAFSMW